MSKIYSTQKIVPLALLLLLMCCGCLEHTFRIDVLPDDKVNLSYEARGDRIDLEDGYDIFPDSSKWDVTRETEEKDDETIHILRAKGIQSSYKDIGRHFDWSEPDDSLHLEKSFIVEEKFALFGKKYLFEGILKSREFSTRYGDIWDFIPEECRVLDDEELKAQLDVEEIELLEEKFSLGILQWNLARYQDRFEKVWLEMKRRGHNLPDTSETVYSIAASGWSDELRLYMNELDVSDPNTVNLEWWEDLHQIFLGRFYDLIGVKNMEICSQIADNMEERYQITKDIENDSYKVELTLPGKISRTNGDKGENGMITWEISGQTLQNEDAVMLATSTEISTWKLVVAALIALTLLRWINRLIFSYASNKKKKPKVD